MANTDNLIPASKRSKAEARENGKKGGIASGESRRRRKKLQEELETLLGGGDTQKQICTSLVMQAIRGNVKAFETIRDTLGEQPTNRIEIDERERSEKVAEIEAYVQRKKNES